MESKQVMVGQNVRPVTAAVVLDSTGQFRSASPGMAVYPMGRTQSTKELVKSPSVGRVETVMVRSPSIGRMEQQPQPQHLSQQQIPVQMGLPQSMSGHIKFAHPDQHPLDRQKSLSKDSKQFIRSPSSK